MWIKNNLKTGLAGLACLTILISLQTDDTFLVLRSVSHIIWPLLALLLLFYTRPVPNNHIEEKLPTCYVILVILLCVYLFSSASVVAHFFFQDWQPGMEQGLLSLKPGVTQWLIITAILLPISPYFKGRESSLLLVFFLCVQAVCFYSLMEGTGGQPFYRDDNPSFLYRLWSYAIIAPKIVYYDPIWNGGYISSYLIGSGIIPLGAIWWPIWKFSSLLQTYTPVLGVTFILIMPWTVMGSLRIINANRTAIYLSGLLGLGICWPYYQYTFHFGTIGSSFCTIFLLPAAAALYRIIWLDLREKWVGAVLIISATILLMWPGSVFMAILLFTGVLLSFKRLSKKNLLFLSVCAAIIIVLLLPVYILLNTHSRAGELMQFTAERPADFSILFSGWSRLCESLRFINPIILFMGIAGLFFIKERGIILLLLPAILGGILLTGWGDEWKPLFQFHRTVIPLSLIALIPAACICSTIINSRQRSIIIMKTALISLFIISGYSSVKYYKTAANADYATIQPYTLQMTEWIKNNTEQNCRILFAGRTVHGVGGGHVAFLPVLAEREMMACDYYHFSPKLVEYNYPPKQWRKHGPKKMFEFMELFNVGYIVTYHAHWKKWLRNHPEQYQEVKSFMQTTLELTVFKTQREYSFFLKGNGQVHSEPGSISVQSSGKEIVLKYNWAEDLQSDKGVTLFPYNAGDNVQLIGARMDGVEKFKIWY